MNFYKTTEEKILIVEDELLVAESLKIKLKTMGYMDVRTVTTGPGAVQTAEEHSPDLILMDIRLHGPMDGIAAAKAIRARRDVPLGFS